MAAGESSQFNIHDAKTNFSRLVERAEKGEEITISRAGRPVAKLVPLQTSGIPRRRGLWRGRVVMHDDFDELPEDIASAFRGEAS
jgi:prevent-host-death family protein